MTGDLDELTPPLEETEQYLYGRIELRAVATRIIQGVAWVFIVLGLFGFLPLMDITGYSLRYMPEGIVVLTIYALPGVILLYGKDTVPGVILFVVNAILALGAIGVCVWVIIELDWVAALISLVPPVVWLCLSYLAWRGVEAAWALRRLRVEDNVTSLVAEVFE